MIYNTLLRRYLCTRQVLFNNRSELKRYFTPLIKDFDIKPVLTSVKKTQANALVERLHQVILNMLITKDLD